MSERMTDARIDLLESHNEDDGVEAEQVAELIAEARLARAELKQKDTVIKALSDYIEKHSGHEENCRGWRRPVKDKSAPAWKRRGEWMDISVCTCGPGALLRLAGRLP